ncbi:MAG: sigma-70 family RNA polymerase sigma factor [Anaerolineae bacterium]|nr:sigma-70 family RNA polymerase sigma factor [Anaerolineae bacterium]
MNEEKTWLLQAKNGSDEAFTFIVETYQTPVYNLCYRMLGHPEEAEDAAQETFLRAYQNIQRYDLNRSFATWLLSIAAHYCIDLLRKRKLPVFSVDESEEYTFEITDAHALHPESETIRGEKQDHIQTLVGLLDTTDRAAIIMRYWYDFSEKEIAESLDITVSAVKSRLHRSRKKLGTFWQESSTTSYVERSPHEAPAF